MRYIANTATRQLHDRHAAEERCNLDDLENGKEIGLAEFKLLLREGFDLCDWCFADNRWGTWTKSPENTSNVERGST
jgi:hypothetical protein